MLLRNVFVLGVAAIMIVSIVGITGVMTARAINQAREMKRKSRDDEKSDMVMQIEVRAEPKSDKPTSDSSVVQLPTSLIGGKEVEIRIKDSVGIVSQDNTVAVESKVASDSQFNTAAASKVKIKEEKDRSSSTVSSSEAIQPPPVSETILQAPKPKPGPYPVSTEVAPLLLPPLKVNEEQSSLPSKPLVSAVQPVNIDEITPSPSKQPLAEPTLQPNPSAPAPPPPPPMPPAQKRKPAPPPPPPIQPPIQEASGSKLSAPPQTFDAKTLQEKFKTLRKVQPETRQSMPDQYTDLMNQMASKAKIANERTVKDDEKESKEDWVEEKESKAENSCHLRSELGKIRKFVKPVDEDEEEDWET